MSDYERKIERAIALLRAIPQDTEIEVAVSGGKDSDVILQLAKEAGIPFRAIHKCTTIDPPGTLKHVKELGCEIRMPEMSFLDIVRKKGTPTRRARFCCEILKEYKILDRVIIGVRRSESSARAERYKEPEQCRKYGKGQKVIQYYPLLDWTDSDVERFIKERGLKCAPVYYDTDGNFHIERRLGCIGCPMSSLRQQREEFKKYPKLLRNIIKAQQYYLDTHPHVNTKKNFLNAYNIQFHNLFCNSYAEYHNFIGGGIFGDELAIDTKAFLEDYFGIDLTI